jgi:hypothetical protein
MGTSTGRAPCTAPCTAHQPGGPCQETNGIGGSAPFREPAAAEFHTYAVEFDRSVSPDSSGVTWRPALHTVRADQVDATTWRNATDHGFFLILNVAVGGGWPGARPRPPSPRGR